MCRNGRYTERGIKALDGYGAQRWRVETDFAVRLDPGLEDVGVLMEPTSVVAKAWDHIERIGARACTRAETVLVTGAGPIGLLAALLGRQRGLDVHVLDVVEAGTKPDAVRALGATYHCKELPDDLAADITLECTGVGALVLEVMQRSAVGGIVCLTGVSSGGHTLGVDAGALNREIVLENDVVFGSVNANRHHYALAAEALAAADRSWLRSLITRRVPIEDWDQALSREADDIKVVIDLDA
jgi:threonine dehydrogenase-like Zn-dependent dehydrogenase